MPEDRKDAGSGGPHDGVAPGALRRFLPVLQLVHLVALFCVPICYTIFLVLSAPHDRMRNLVSVAFILAVSVWSSAVLIYCLITGDEEPSPGMLVKQYRKLLVRPRFVVAGNLVLLATLGFLLYQVVAYRQVPFVASRDCDLYVRNPEGDAVLFGSIRERQVLSFRLRVGEQFIMVGPLMSGEADREVFSVHVRPYWSFDRQQRVETACGRS